jgi:hypothetical protein
MRILIQFLFMEWEYATSQLQTLHGLPNSQWVNFEPPQLLNFHFDSDRDLHPTSTDFHADADPAFHSPGSGFPK